ncbi:hypothetical protein SynBIOSU31_02956 [Synechococcus sp. BIOS-U3-1]|nr:hypothetical protein SynBIOSU31_02956 [Synechococcus sp. BIOS-U3-1]
MDLKNPTATVFTNLVGTASTRPLQANKNPTRESGALKYEGQTINGNHR